MHSGEHDINLFNNEVTTFLSEYFGDEIKFRSSKQKNQSAFVFSASLEMEDVISNLRSFDATKTVVAELRKSIRTVDFRHKGKFSDAGRILDINQNTKSVDYILLQTLYHQKEEVSSYSLIKCHQQLRRRWRIWSNPANTYHLISPYCVEY